MDEPAPSRQGGERWSRNALWMSPQLREVVRRSHLVVVGCGGNGVSFLVNAAHVGFRRFTLCDPDLLGESNLNRFMVALPAQVRQPKVRILEEYLLSRFEDVEVEAVQEAFPGGSLLPGWREATMIVGCLDDVHTRIQVDALARKYGRAVLDLGSGFAIDAASGMPVAAGGQVLFSRPGGPCLMCLGFDAGAAQNNYFIPQSDAPEPSSLLLNNIVGALATECLLRELSGQMGPTNRVAYDRATLSITMHSLPGYPNCRVCGEGAQMHLGSVGDAETLFAALAGEGIECKTV